MERTISQSERATSPRVHVQLILVEILAQAKPRGLSKSIHTHAHADARTLIHYSETERNEDSVEPKPYTSCVTPSSPGAIFRLDKFLIRAGPIFPHRCATTITTTTAAAAAATTFYLSGSRRRDHSRNCRRVLVKMTLTHRHGVPRKKKKDGEGRVIKGGEGQGEDRTLTRCVIARISKCVYKLGHRWLADTGTATARGIGEEG